jgi:ADP-ribose pyrophosphatase YjhB (NUDIX family)
LLFFNPTVAVGAFLEGPDRHLLLIRRAKEPARGRLALPGGFVDIGERVEDALRREILEEVNLEVDDPQFLCSAPNTYRYRDVAYPVADLFFVVRARDSRPPAALDGVASFAWHAVNEIDPDDFAFPSLRAAFADYCAQRGA